MTTFSVEVHDDYTGKELTYIAGEGLTLGQAVALGKEHEANGQWVTIRRHN